MLEASEIHTLSQPLSQGLSSPHRKGSEGRKTLVQAGHVLPKKVGGEKNIGMETYPSRNFAFLNSLWERKICLKLSHTASTARGDIEDTEKDIYSV